MTLTKEEYESLVRSSICGTYLNKKNQWKYCLEYSKLMTWCFVNNRDRFAIYSYIEKTIGDVIMHKVKTFDNQYAEVLEKIHKD